MPGGTLPRPLCSHPFCVRAPLPRSATGSRMIDLGALGSYPRVG